MKGELERKPEPGGTRRQCEQKAAPVTGGKEGARGWKVRRQGQRRRLATASLRAIPAFYNTFNCKKNLFCFQLIKERESFLMFSSRVLENNPMTLT